MDDIRRSIFEYFNYLRNQGWRGTFMYNSNLVTVLGTYRCEITKAANDNG